MNEFVDAMRSKGMPAFKRRYREVDVLLVDDIQFLERTEQLQEEFFYTFNDLHGRGSQIVISSDRPPKSIATIEDRLRSRFEWGLITDIQPPEFETRLAILRKKAEAEHLDGIPDGVLAFIADNVVDNVRELEGSLIRVAAYSSLHRVPLSEDVAKEILSDLLPARSPRVITPQLILETTAKMFGWTIDDLCGKSRRRPLVTARQIGMYVFRELTDYSYPKIAEEFGGRDHTTVMHACEKIRARWRRSAWCSSRSTTSSTGSSTAQVDNTVDDRRTTSATRQGRTRTSTRRCTASLCIIGGRTRWARVSPDPPATTRGCPQSTGPTTTKTKNSDSKASRRTV